MFIARNGDKALKIEHPIKAEPTALRPPSFSDKKPPKNVETRDP